MIDVNISLFRWPTRRLPLDETPRLVEFLRAKGVTQAWAGSFEGLLHLDIAGVNERLAQECAAHGPDLLIPFGSINPTLPDWEDDLRRCREVHGMPGVRLHPNYHGYELDHPAVPRLIELAAERGLIVQLAARMEDPRTQHRLLSVPDVDLRPLADLATRFPTAKFVLLNALMGTATGQLAALTEAGQVFWELATLEGVNGLTRLLATLPPTRILFGTHAPFFVWESAALKLRESALPGPIREQIVAGNAAKLRHGAP